MPSDRRENPEQIPSSHNEEQTEARVSEQARIEGERKEVDVKDYPKAAAIAQILKDLEFPADKKQIVDHIERARPQSEEILADIQKIEDKQYQNVSDVTRAAGLVRQ
jgi:glycerol dehydrogenase-like iron-containing ADH family enzyme